MGVPAASPSETADVVAIGRLTAAWADAVNRRDLDAFATLWTEDAVWTIADLDLRFAGAAEIAAGARRLVGERFAVLVQLHGPAAVELAGAAATGRVYGAAIARGGDGAELRTLGCYDDVYRRTADGWRLARRAYRSLVRESTPTAGATA